MNQQRSPEGDDGSGGREGPPTAPAGSGTAGAPATSTTPASTTPASTTAGGGHPRRWYVLAVLIVSLLVIVLDNTVLNIALKTIADPRVGLGATQSELEWSINSYTLVFAGLLFTFGIIGDRVGRKRMLMIGLLLFGLSSLLSAYAQSPDQLIWARAAMGVGGAAVMPQTLSIITNVFEPAQRARAIGIWAGAVGIAIALGPITGGLLLEHFWWGSVFLINVPIVLAGVAAVLFIVPESRNPSPGRLDPLGVILSVAGLVSLTYGIIRGGEHAAWLEWDVLGPIALGIAVLGVFVRHEARTANPALDVRLFRDPRLSVSVGAIALVFFALAGVFFFITFYLQSVRNFTPLEAGLLSLPIAVAQLVFAPWSARLVRQYGARAVCAAGLLMVAGSMASYQAAGTDSPIWLLELTFLLQGTGMALVMPPATESIMSVLPRERAGAGSAIANTARQVAVSFGVAVLGSLVSVVYRGRMTGPLDGLPVSPDVRQAAGESIGATMAVVERLGPGGVQVIEPAHRAFVSAMHTASAVSAVVALISAIVVLAWMPGRTRPSGGEAPEWEPEPVRA
jgi:EmrB/QacA subfamily drug resistance transporter